MIRITTLLSAYLILPVLMAASPREKILANYDYLGVVTHSNNKEITKIGPTVITSRGYLAAIDPNKVPKDGILVGINRGNEGELWGYYYIGGIIFDTTVYVRGHYEKSGLILTEFDTEGNDRHSFRVHVIQRARGYVRGKSKIPNN